MYAPVISPMRAANEKISSRAVFVDIVFRVLGEETFVQKGDHPFITSCGQGAQKPSKGCDFYCGS